MTPREPRRPFWYLRRPRHKVRADVDEELRVHLEMRAEELKAAGLQTEDAQREAVRQFGDLEATRRYCERQGEQKETDMHRGLMLEDLAQDLRISLRSLLRVPTLTFTILITVGLGIGATTVIFAAIDAALLRPLPYADPSRLVWIYTDAPPFMFRFSAVDYLALEAQQTQFERIAGFTDRSMAFNNGTNADLVRGRSVSWGYFATLGISPALGRDFTETDGRPGSPPAVILSQSFWQQRLGGRPDVVGTAIKLDAAEYAVVGVLPRTLGPLEQRQEFFVAAQVTPPPRRGPFPYWMIGRLRSGIDAAAATSELRAINRRIFPIWKSSYQDDKATWSLMDLKERLVGNVKTTAGLALAAVALVWLIACVNASSLLIARVSSRRRELAVRAALGASRRRVVRHLLVESALLASGAAAIGLALAWAGVNLLRDVGAAYFPRTQEIAIDGPVLAVLLTVTLVSVAIFGLIPALSGSGRDVDQTLHASERASTGSPTARRLRRGLVATQFAISTPLLVVAALLLVSLNERRKVDLGFDGANLVSGSIRLPGALYQQEGSITSYWDELSRRLAALPGGSEVAFTDGRPPNNANNTNNFDLEDFPTPPGQSQPATPWVAVTPEFFRILGLQLLEGRLLEERDGQQETVLSVVVDRSWSKRFFPNGSALGKRFREGGCTDCPWTTVVGIVGDVKFNGLDQPNQGTVYWNLVGRVSRFAFVKTVGDPALAVPSIRQILRELDPSVPLTDVATVPELVAQSLQAPRALSLLVAGFALVALTLSVVGIYGVMVYYVQQHTREIGVRLALGGSRPSVLRMVVGQGMLIVGIGVIVGLVAAVLSTRLMATLLFGVSSTDALTLIGVSLFLLLMALGACLAPARRAINLQPATVLRTE